MENVSLEKCGKVRKSAETCGDVVKLWKGKFGKVWESVDKCGKGGMW